MEKIKTRDLILQQTLGLMFQKGYNGVSVSDIQEATGMARGLLYHYFTNQEQLREEAMQTFMDKWCGYNKDRLKNHSISELIAFIIQMYQEMGEEIQVCYGDKITLVDVRLLFLEAERQGKGLKELFEKINNDYYAIWKSAVLNSFGRGELRAGLNLESLTRYFSYMENGFFFTPTSSEIYSELIYNFEKKLREFYEIVKR